MAPKSTTELREIPASEKEPEQQPKLEIVWINVLLFVILHSGAIYGLYLMSIGAAKLNTCFFFFSCGLFSSFGITAAAHRLWSHRTYKAKLPLRILLIIMNTIAGQNSILIWCRDHRVHHKFAETNADPHNIKRGFFFAHMGWLMCKKHPDVKEKGKTIILNDLMEDPVVHFQYKYYVPMAIVLNLFLPTMIPVWFWNETLWNSYFICFLARYCVVLNFTWLVNSAAHMYGNRPFDTNIWARENRLVAFMALGEGWHNYHHTFPWDYSTSELGYFFNNTKLFIDFMALIGQAYDLKTANPDMINNMKLKLGDGTRRENIPVK